MKIAGCSRIKASPDLALQVLAAFGKAADNAASETAPGATEEQALQQLDIERKAIQPLIKDVYLSKEKQEDLTMALCDFFLESSACVARHVCEHPALKKFCRLAGLPSLKRKRLADPVLDKKYAATIKQFDDKLVKQTIGVQIGTDG